MASGFPKIFDSQNSPFSRVKPKPTENKSEVISPVNSNSNSSVSYQTNKSEKLQKTSLIDRSAVRYPNQPLERNWCRNKNTSLLNIDLVKLLKIERPGVDLDKEPMIDSAICDVSDFLDTLQVASPTSPEQMGAKDLESGPAGENSPENKKQQKKLKPNSSRKVKRKFKNEEFIEKTKRFASNFQRPSDKIDLEKILQINPIMGDKNVEKSELAAKNFELQKCYGEFYCRNCDKSWCSKNVWVMQRS